jgi:hypothetical protein
LERLSRASERNTALGFSSSRFLTSTELDVAPRAPTRWGRFGGPGGHHASACMLLSFERPTVGSPPAGALLSDLENCTVIQQTDATVTASLRARCCAWRGARPFLRGVFCKIDQDHRQDVKGTWWMPWHQESMKGVNGCDKPRGGAEWPVIRGYPNGETHRW